MEDLARLVADSLARHGYDAPVDHRRLEWSRWFRCESSLSFLLVPSSPGIYALGEEIGTPGSSASPISSKRMLAVFEISETDDLGAALSRLFAPGHPLRDRLASGRCFVRYSRVSDRDQRTAASNALRQWLASSMEVATGLLPVDGSAGVLARSAPAPISEAFVTRPQPEPSPQAPIATTSKVALRRSPPPLPAGF
jgi:hypothetical protein